MLMREKAALGMTAAAGSIDQALAHLCVPKTSSELMT
jgi:hypothetical protein